MSNLDHALAYAANGLVVIPLWPGRKMPHASRKHPEQSLLGASFSLSTVGTTDPDLIRYWFSREPEAGIGVVCGHRSRFMPIDIDCHGKKDQFGDPIDGQRSFLHWLTYMETQEGYDFPDCPMVSTPGGAHLWGLVPEGFVQGTREFLPGVEMLSGDHWIAVPPTEVQRGATILSYQRVTPPMAVPEWPPWVLESVYRSRRPRQVNGHRSTYDLTHSVAVSRGGVRPEGPMPPDEAFMEHGLGWWWEPASRNRDAYELAYRAWCKHGVEQRVVGIVYAAWQATTDKSDSSWDEMLQCVESAGHRVRAQRSEVWS